MDTAQNRKNLVLLALTAIVVVYIAVSVYGVIRDLGTGGTVFVISSTMPRNENVDQKPPILDRIKAIIKVPARVIVPVEKLVTIKGRVIYTDGTPYAYGLVELHSEPRTTTYTDSEGRFIFERVKDGKNTISVLSASHQVLASCNVEINRDSTIEDAVLVQMNEDTWVLEVAVDVKVLEIVLKIWRDDNGLPARLTINPEVKVLERYIPGEEPINPTTPPTQPIPITPPVIYEELPSGGGPGGVIPRPGDGTLTVYSTDTNKKFGKTPEPVANINIFGTNKTIAPGMMGTYKFTVDNTANPFAICYDIALKETNNSLNIPMRYRLKNNITDNYVNGDLDWHTTGEISGVTANPSVALSMNDSRKTDYTLEWFWLEGANDNSYAAHGGATACTLAITVTAQRK